MSILKGALQPINVFMPLSDFDAISWHTLFQRFPYKNIKMKMRTLEILLDVNLWVFLLEIIN